MKYSDIVFRGYGDKLHVFCYKRYEKHYFWSIFKKAFATNIRPICIKTTKNTKNILLFVILRSSSEWKNNHMNICVFLKKVKKWKHTVNYNHFEYIFHKSYVFDAVFKGRIGVFKKVKKWNLLASEAKNTKKRWKIHKNTKN